MTGICSKEMVQHVRCKQATYKRPRAPCSWKTNGTQHACPYRYTYFDTYSGRHVLGLLLCVGGMALCCAVLAVQRHTYPYIYTAAVLLLVAVYVRYGYSKRKKRWKKKREIRLLLYNMIEDIYACWLSPTLYACY